jgi:hypothetical protein
MNVLETYVFSPVDRKLKSINPNVKNIENPSRTTAASCLKWWNKDSYLHVSQKCKSLAASHFLYDWARDIFDFSFDQKYESINENDKTLKIDP